MAVPDIEKVKTAFRASLIGNAPLMALVAGVFNGQTPPEIGGVAFDWALPVLEYGTQATPNDLRGSYGDDDGLDITMRLMARDRGATPGIGDFGRCYAALAAAHDALIAAPPAPVGLSLWRFKRSDGIPEAMPSTEGGYRFPQVGVLYQVRVRVPFP